MAVIEKQRVVTLISGSGSTMAEIIQATKDDRLPRTEVVGVISSNHQTRGIQKALELKLPERSVRVVDPTLFPEKPRFAEVLTAQIQNLKPDIVIQVGWSPHTPDQTLAELSALTWLNQHGAPVDPSPYDFGGRYMSCTPRFTAARLMFVRATDRNFWTDGICQRVSPVFDKGAVLKRGRTEILPNDSVEKLIGRHLVTERAVQIDALRDFENGTAWEQPPYTNLVLFHERPLLELAKQIARHTYTKDGEKIPNPNYFRVLIELRDAGFTYQDVIQMVACLQPRN